MNSILTMFTTTIGSAAVIAAISALFFSSKKRSELHRKNKTAHSFLLAFVFGILSIYASVSAVSVDGLLCNCRNLPPLYAGMVGGPIAGIGAALIGGIYRYFVGGPARFSCSIACLVAGILGAAIHLFVKKEKRYNVLTGAVASVIVEVIHFALACAFGLYEGAKVVVWPSAVAGFLGMMFCLYIYTKFDQTGHDVM